MSIESTFLPLILFSILFLYVSAIQRLLAIINQVIANYMKCIIWFSNFLFALFQPKCYMQLCTFHCRRHHRHRHLFDFHRFNFEVVGSFLISGKWKNSPFSMNVCNDHEIWMKLLIHFNEIINSWSNWIERNIFFLKAQSDRKIAKNWL